MGSVTFVPEEAAIGTGTMAGASRVTLATDGPAVVDLDAMKGATMVAPASGVSATIAADASVLIAKGMTIGKRYCLTMLGGDPACLCFDHTAATIAKNAPWFGALKWPFVATAVDIAAIKYTAGSTSPTFWVEPLDGGGVTAGP